MRLYQDLAWFWKLSKMEPYEVESEFIIEMVERYKRTKGTDILDVGCGAGHHHAYLKGYQITGVDAHEKMLDIAKRNNPDVRYVQGEMQSFHLGRKFDAVTAMDCVAYNTTLEDLRETIVNLVNHMKKGGVLIFSLDEVKETFVQNESKTTKRSGDGKKVILVERSHDPDSRDTEYDLTLNFFIWEKGKVTIEVDEHKIGLFRLDDVKDILAQQGMKVHLFELDYSGKKYEGKGPVFVCHKER